MKKGPLFSSLAAVGSVLAAGSCCLPLGTMWLAASAAGAGAFLPTLRPYLMGLSVLLIAFGFWQVHRATQCGCKRNWLSLSLLWIAAVFVGTSLLFPQLFASLLAG